MKRIIHLIVTMVFMLSSIIFFAYGWMQKTKASEIAPENRTPYEETRIQKAEIEELILQIRVLKEQIERKYPNEQPGH